MDNNETKLKRMLQRLVTTSTGLSTVLHELEGDGIDLDSSQERRWKKNTVVIEESKSLLRQLK